MKPDIGGIGMTSQRTRERLVQRLIDQGVSNISVLDKPVLANKSVSPSFGSKNNSLPSFEAKPWPAKKNNNFCLIFHYFTWQPLRQCT